MASQLRLAFQLETKPYAKLTQPMVKYLWFKFLCLMQLVLYANLMTYMSLIPKLMYALLKLSYVLLKLVYILPKLECTLDHFLTQRLNKPYSKLEHKLAYVMVYPLILHSDTSCPTLVHMHAHLNCFKLVYLLLEILLLLNVHLHIVLLMAHLLLAVYLPVHPSRRFLNLLLRLVEIFRPFLTRRLIRTRTSETWLHLLLNLSLPFKIQPTVALSPRLVDPHALDAAADVLLHPLQRLEPTDALLHLLQRLEPLEIQILDPMLPMNALCHPKSLHVNLLHILVSILKLSSANSIRRVLQLFSKTTRCIGASVTSCTQSKLMLLFLQLN